MSHTSLPPPMLALWVVGWVCMRESARESERQQGDETEREEERGRDGVCV